MKKEMRGNIPERIYNAYDKLTPSERRIADVLFDSDLMVGLENVATLAQRAKVSGPTVIRFATKLGFEGFPQLQAVLREKRPPPAPLVTVPSARRMNMLEVSAASSAPAMRR